MARLPVLPNQRVTLAPAARPALTVCWVPLTSTTNAPALPVPRFLIWTLTPITRFVAQPPVQPCGAVMADETTRSTCEEAPLTLISTQKGLLNVVPIPNFAPAAFLS